MGGGGGGDRGLVSVIKVTRRLSEILKRIIKVPDLVIRACHPLLLPLRGTKRKH